jgi:hypothetical protein
MLQACKKDTQDIKIGYIDDRYWYLDSTVIVTGNTRVAPKIRTDFILYFG